MPAHHAKNNSKSAIAKAVAENMKELNKPDAKPRSQAQKVAIAYAEAKPVKKLK